MNVRKTKLEKGDLQVWAFGHILQISLVCHGMLGAPISYNTSPTKRYISGKSILQLLIHCLQSKCNHLPLQQSKINHEAEPSIPAVT